MRQIRKRRHGSGTAACAAAVADARDPDIVHAHRVAPDGNPATTRVSR